MLVSISRLTTGDWEPLARNRAAIGGERHRDLGHLAANAPRFGGHGAGVEFGGLELQVVERPVHVDGEIVDGPANAPVERGRPFDHGQFEVIPEVGKIGGVHLEHHIDHVILRHGTGCGCLEAGPLQRRALDHHAVRVGVDALRAHIERLEPVDHAAREIALPLEPLRGLGVLHVGLAVERHGRDVAVLDESAPQIEIGDPAVEHEILGFDVDVEAAVDLRAEHGALHAVEMKALRRHRALEVHVRELDAQAGAGYLAADGERIDRPVERRASGKQALLIADQSELMQLRKRDRVDDQLHAAQPSFAKCAARNHEGLVEMDGKVVELDRRRIAARVQPDRRHRFLGIDQVRAAFVDHQVAAVVRIVECARQVHVSHRELAAVAAELHGQAVDAEAAHGHDRRHIELAAAVAAGQHGQYQLAVGVLAQVDVDVAQRQVGHDEPEREDGHEVVLDRNLVGAKHVV